MSRRNPTSGKPRIKKPFADYPLVAHVGSGQWSKKLKTPAGWKTFYFGKLDDPMAALARYKQEHDDLRLGQIPDTRRDAPRLAELCNKFLHAKRTSVDAGELTMRSWYDYQETCRKVIEILGREKFVEDIGPEEFEELKRKFASAWGATKVGNEINRTRMLFRYGFESGLVAATPRFGPTFKRPSRQTQRRLKAARKVETGGAGRMYTAEELRAILGAADVQMRAMVLLAVNCGLHNADIATLYRDAVNLDTGWLVFPRGKTGVPRRCPLWPETVEAVREWLAVRPEPKDDAHGHLVFLTKQRRPWYRHGRFVRDEDGERVVGVDNPVAKAFSGLLQRIGLHRVGRSFGKLRHTFSTVAKRARDQEAKDAIMGHLDAGRFVQSHYEDEDAGVPDERLRAVVEVVRGWLFGT